MYGLIARIRAKNGEAEKLASIMLEGISGMPGCVSYIVAHDSKEEDALWVTEVWENRQSHQASLAHPSVRAAIESGGR